jgi:hypothetical protein
LLIFADFGKPVAYRAALDALQRIGAVVDVELSQQGDNAFVDFVEPRVAESMLRRGSYRLSGLGWIQFADRCPRLCRFDQLGKCNNGRRCLYTHAHSPRVRERSRSPRHEPVFRLRLPRTATPSAQEPAPTQAAPAQDAPAQDAPAEAAPAQDAPAQDASSEEASESEDSVEQFLQAQAHDHAPAEAHQALAQVQAQSQGQVAGFQVAWQMQQQAQQQAWMGALAQQIYTLTQRVDALEKAVK